ncbi:hypothetical protein CCMA1212_003677 [Trichoderma ghanense]|uniref:Uncharacterized protein n=1 Tax=Trichoderma ghanense TaxID=65468 RepID=A0ABY2H8B1_9HYPO
MPRDPLIGLVGKPSAGKSSMLNSLTDASSKVGNFPFTTIDPQRAIGYLQIDCACARFNLSDKCKPNYGSCVNGRRSVPIELLDVAGLVPGAHQGRGLGNKFLDDLRHADALIHVVDASGTVDAEGKETRGYDPSVDIAWLRSEIVAWILGNLMQKWGGIKRRHIAVKATAVETLQNQFSGYGSTPVTVQRTLDRSGVKEPLEEWSDETIEHIVNCFIDEKFPTVIALNKIDHPDADKNIAKIAKMQDPNTVVLCSAISEIFLRKMAKQGYIKYVEGSEFIDTREDLIEQGDPTGGGLKELDEKNRNRIENLKDMVLYRFGSTGVVQVLSKAAELLGLVPVFPVRNTTTFSSGASESKFVFRDCVLVRKGLTVGDVARKVMGDAPIAFVEGVGNMRVSEDDPVAVGKNDILSFKRLSRAGQPSKQNVAGRQPTARATKELEALQALQRSMIDEFAQNPSEAYAIEITPLASLVDVDDYVRLFDRFHNAIAAAALDGKMVDTELLRAFEAFLHCRQTGLAGRKLNLGSAMLSIQKALDRAVDAAHNQTKYNSIRALSTVLDAMNEVKAGGIADVQVQSLLKRLEKLRDHNELRLAEAASYSYQALLAIPTDVSPWRKIGSSAVKTLMGGARVAGSVWSLDPSKLVEGLVDLTEAPKLISLIIEVVKSCGDLVGSASGTGKAFKTLKKPKDWYIALRATDGLVWANAPKHLEALLRHPDLPCREVKDFLCGICAQLEMARSLNHEPVCDVLEAFITTQASRTKSCRVLEWARLVTGSPQLDSPNLPRYRRRKVYHTTVERAKAMPQQPRRQLLDNAWRNCHKVREFYADQMLRDHYADEDLKLLRIERLDGSKLSLEECYINLAVVRTSGDNILRSDSDSPSPSPFSILRRLEIWEPPKTERVDLEALFDRRSIASVGAAIDGSSQDMPMRILIRGQAGAGKTTLCKKLVHDFLCKGMWAEIIDRVIWIPLRQIKGSLESGQSISNLMSRPLPDGEKAGKGTLGEALEGSFEENPGRTLFILDGFDEVYRELYTPGNELLIKLINVPRVIITARPRGVNRELFQNIHLELETIGFYPIQVKQYIEKHAGDKAAEIHSFIEGHPVVAGLARIPIQLDAVCYSMVAGTLDGSSPPGTMTELYHAIEGSLWNKDVEMLDKRREGSDEPVLKHEAEASYPDDVRRLCQAEVNALQALSFTGLVNNIVEFDPVFLRSFHDVQHTITSNIPTPKAQPWFTDLDKLSFLRTSDGPLTPSTRSYHFLHLTFQEMFAAQFFVQHWMSKKDIMVFDYECKDPTPIGPETFLLREKYNPSYDVFWRFVSGIIQLQRDERALCRFFQAIEKEPRDLLGPAHLRLTMHCLAEVNSKAYEPAAFADVRQSVQSRMKEWLFLESEISTKTMRRLVGEPEYPVELLREAAGMMGDDKNSLRTSFIYGLSARPRVSPSLVDLVVEWSRDFIDGYDDDEYDYDEGRLDLSLATMSLLWHAPRSTPSTLALLSKLLDHPDRHIYQQAAVTVWKVAENLTETEYNPLIAKGLVECLSVRNADTRVGVLTLMRDMLDLPADAFERLQKLAHQRPVWLGAYKDADKTSLYEDPEKMRNTLVKLAETANIESVELSVSDALEEQETETPLRGRAEIISDTLRRWKDDMYNSNYVVKLESVEDVVLQRLAHSEYRDDEFATMTLDSFTVDALFDILGTKNHGLSDSRVEGLAKFLASGGMYYDIFDMLFACFTHQEDALAQLAVKLQRRRYDAPIVPPDAIFNSVAELVGGSGPLHRAVAAVIMNQHPRLPPCVWETLLDGLEAWEDNVRECALLFLATEWEHEKVMDMLMARFNVPKENGRPGAFPPQLCKLIQDIAFQALTSPKAEAMHFKFWAVDAVLKYPASGIMGLVVRLEEKHLAAVYQLWLEEALEESLSWRVEGKRICIRTSSGVVVAEGLESEEVVLEFVRRIRGVRATMRIPW